MFPFTLTFKRHFRSIDPYSRLLVLKGIARYVEKNKGRVDLLSDTQLSFRVSFIGRKEDKFADIEKGIFTLEETSLTFRVYMYRDMAILAIMCGFIAFWSTYLWLGIFIFLLLGLVSRLHTLIKYRRLINDIAKGVNRLLDGKAPANGDSSAILVP